MSIDNEYASWVHNVQNLLGKDVELIDRSALQNMYDDGLEPEDVADPTVRGRYMTSRARKHVSDNLSELFTEA